PGEDGAAAQHEREQREEGRLDALHGRVVLAAGLVRGGWPLRAAGLARLESTSRRRSWRMSRTRSSVESEARTSAGAFAAAAEASCTIQFAWLAVRILSPAIAMNVAALAATPSTCTTLSALKRRRFE